MPESPNQIATLPTQQPIPPIPEPTTLQTSAKAKNFPLFSIIIGFTISILLLFSAAIIYFVWSQKLIFTLIDPSNPQLKSAGISYAFEAKITGIKKTNEGTIVQTDSPIPNIPQLLVTSRSIVHKKINGKYNQVDVGELKVGQHVSVSIYYHLTGKVWLTTIVYML